MKSEDRSERLRSERLEVDRRSFVGLGLKTVAALGVLPAASSWLAGCGSAEQTSTPAASKPSSAAPQPAAAPAAKPDSPPPPKQAAATAPSSGSGERPLVTEVAAMAPTVQALQYVNESAKPDQHCAICQFYTPEGGGLGKCQLFAQGYVKEGGWCLSWTKKLPTPS